jgi:POTRA domain, FtsQ-type
MSTGLPVRRGGPQVRRRPVRRSSPRLRQVQFVALLVMAMCVLGIWNVGATPVFGAHNLELSGARFTSRTEVEALIGLEGSPNLFRFAADRLADKLVRLPAVETANVDIRLPSTIAVSIVEREPRVVWVIGSHRYVADQDGLLFGLVDDAGNAIPSDAGPLQPTPSPSPSPSPSASPTPEVTGKPSPARSSGGSGPVAGTTALPGGPSLVPVPTPNPATTRGPQALGLPVVFDRRAVSAKWGLGSRVDPVNLDAGYRLGTIKPADVGTTTGALTVVLDDDHGFTVSPTPAKWVAEFGFYTPNRRKDTVIPTQVRDLGLLLAKWGEDGCVWVWLVADISDAHSNSCLPR